MGKIDTFIQTRILRPIRLNAILKILNKLPAGKIIDLGCMDDYLLKRLPKKFDYLGYDENPLCNNKKITKGKIENISQNKKFDIVMATEVLEHVDDPVEAIRNLKKLSKKYVLISVPNEPFFSMFRFFFPAKEHLWTIFPWALEKHLGRPVFKQRACFNRTYIGLWDLKVEKKTS